MRILNKKAKFNYKLETDRAEAGIALTGGEAKSVRTGHADLSLSYAKIINGEVFLINANIPVSGAKDYDPKRTRKLLLHKSEIVSLESKIKQKKLTIVPTSLYTKGRLIKVKLALGKTKKRFEKKEAKKRKDIEREIERELKGK